MTLLKKRFPDAVVDYEIPNAMVGYQPGWGAAADRWPVNSTGKSARQRILVLVAVKNDLALVSAAVGLAQDMGKYVNSLRWKGDPPD